MKQALSLLFILILLTACTPLTPVTNQPATQPQPENTSPAPEAQPATQENRAAETDTIQQPTYQPPAPEAQPTECNSPAQPEEDLHIPGTAEIAILRPGQYSRLVSPIRLIASFSYPEDTHTFITLFGEDGRVLAERKFKILPYDDPVNGNVITDLDFSIEEMNAVGRLEFKTFDQFNRLRALNSVNLILMSEGPADRNYDPEDSERIQLQIPFPGQTEIEGGRLFLSGLVRFIPAIRTGDPEPLTIQLVDESGTITAQGCAPVILSPGSLTGQFVAEIEYQVSEPTRVLLTIGIIEGRLQTPAYVKTFPLTLLP